MLPSPSLDGVSGDGKSGPASHEILILDGDPTILKGLERLLTDAGLTVSAFEDPVRARDQLEKRFIPVVLCDLDTPAPGAGVDLIRFVREKSPLTAVIAMSPRKSFEAVAPAFRAGAQDVIPKTQDSVNYLRDRVLAAATDVRVTVSKDQLLSEVAEVHDEFLKKMMDLSRQVTDLEDKVLSREDSSTASGLGPINVLLVDDEPALNAVLSRDLPVDKGWRLRYAQSGGEALDAATQVAPAVLVIKDELPDLPTRMVINTIKTGSPVDVVVLQFSPPTDDGPGEIKMVDQSRLLVLVPSFSLPDQLVGALEEVREALRKKSRERRYLVMFRKQHMEFLKKYNLVKQRLEQKLPDG